MLSETERVTLAVQFATGFMQSGRSFPSFRELAILGLDFVNKMEEEVAKQRTITVKADVIKMHRIRSEQG